MSSNLNTANLPAPATKVGGVRHGCAVYRPKADDESPTPQTNVETALGAQNQQDLHDALGVPIDNPNMSVHDAAEHPKVNASTYQPDQPKHQQNAQKHRGNAGHVQNIQQIGGAYGAQRH